MFVEDMYILFDIVVLEISIFFVSFYYTFVVITLVAYLLVFLFHFHTF